jgi:transposase
MCIMAKAIKLQAHLDTAELARRYRAARDPVERSHYQLIWLLAQGKTTSEVMAATGYSRGWVQEIARRYNQQGPSGLGDRRHHNPGGPPLLDEAGCEGLRAALAGTAPDGGLWSGPKVAAWIADQLGRAVSERVGWIYLRKVDYRPKVPRPAHAEADPQEQAAFPKA